MNIYPIKSMLFQRITLLFIAILITKSLSAQQIAFEYGRVSSIFNYTNSDGEKLENLQSSFNNHLGVLVKLPINKSGLYALSACNFNKYTSRGSDADVGNYYDWEVNYIGANIGIGYEILKSNTRGYLQSNGIRSDLTIYTHLLFAIEFLTKGSQTINNEVYDLKGVEQFDKPFAFAKGTIGVNYYVSRDISVYMQYTGGMSLPIFKPNADDKEKLNFITHTASLGIQVSFPYKNYK